MTNHNHPLRDTALALAFDATQRRVLPTPELARAIDRASMVFGEYGTECGGDFVATHAVRLARLLEVDGWGSPVVRSALADITRRAADFHATLTAAAEENLR